MKQSICKVALIIAIVATLGIVVGCDGGIKSDVAAEVHKSMEKSGSGKPSVSADRIEQAKQRQGGRSN